MFCGQPRRHDETHCLRVPMKNPVLRAVLRLVAVAGLLVSSVEARAAAADGAALFAQLCAMCHGADGKAQTPIARKIGVKDLTVSKFTEAEVTQRIREGFRSKSGTPLMPAFKEKLTPDDTAAVVKFVLGLRH